MDSDESNQPQSQSSTKKWLKRLGIWGFLFFLIKGLLWLIVPAALVWWGAH